MAIWPQSKKSTEVLGLSMAYVEIGSGSPIVFLHGNPTSSFLWRNIVGPVSELGRCIAPDLIGMGDSSKLLASGPDSYTLAEHQRYVDAFMEAADATENVVLVLHDWGSALGFDWARRHADHVRGIIYMESIVRPMATWEWSGAEAFFQRMHSEEGETLVLDQNFFVEQVLPRSIIRTLEEDEMEEYRRPFRVPGEDRRPTLAWPRQMPLNGEPADVVETVKLYGDWLSASEVPKLFINAEPGAMLTGGMRDFCRTWPNQSERTVPGIHFIQEDSANAISAAIAEWLPTLPAIV